jgi:hypothetical protein
MNEYIPLRLLPCPANPPSRHAEALRCIPLSDHADDRMMFRQNRYRGQGAIDASLAHTAALPCADLALAESYPLVVYVSFAFSEFFSVCHFRLADA